MRLAKLTLCGFRRFRHMSTIRFPTRVFALLGPNEVGKTTVLDAIKSLASNSPLQTADVSHDFSPPPAPFIEGEFTLDPTDRQALAKLPGGEKVEKVIVRQTTSGRSLSIEPAIAIDDSAERSDAMRALTIPPEPIAEQATEAVKFLAEGEPLGKGQYQHLADLVDKLAGSSDERTNTVADTLIKLIEKNRLSSDQVAAEAHQILIPRIPRIIDFGAPDRELSSSYPIAELVKSNEAPRALANLLRAAGVSLEDLNTARRSGTARARFEKSAKAALDEAMTRWGKWSQADIDVSLRVMDGRVEIHVEGSGPDGIPTNIDERSDGLRQFIALSSLIGRNADDAPILLVDEAELHLHYDAQADLVRMFQEQDAVGQIIYTTHSAGCLPNDLGFGVGGALKSGGDGHWSKLTNNFWHPTDVDLPGVRPLLVALGAGMLAFLPLRDAVFVEGISDAILLPQLFREALGKPNLDLPFQVVPGLSSAAKSVLKKLDSDAPSVGYVVDRDAAGAKIQKDLVDQGIRPDRIFQYPAVCLENLVDAHAFATALQVVGSHHDFGDFVPPDSGKSYVGALDEWCKNRELKVPSKRMIASTLLDMSADRPVLATSLKGEVRTLYLTIIDAIGGTPST